MRYVATALIPYYKECFAQNVVECRLRFNGKLVVRPLRSRTGRQYHVDECRNGHLIVSLLGLTNCAFKLAALASLDEPTLPPFGYVLYVDAELFNVQMERDSTIVGETELVQFFNKFRIVHMPHAQLRETAVPPAKRARRTGQPEHGFSDAQQRALSRMLEVEACARTIPLLTNTCVAVPDTNYAFSFAENAFVPVEVAEDQYAKVQLRGGLVVGARNAGKTRVAAALFKRSGATPLDTPPSMFLHRTRASLCIVPTPLIAQWCAALDAANVTYAVVVDKASWSASLTRRALDSVIVVLTTHSFLYSNVQLMSAHLSRFSSRAALRDESDSTPFRLEWVYWQRVVVDEIEQLFLEHTRVWPKLLQCLFGQFWWGLQGGVESSAVLRALNLLDAVSLMPGAGVVNAEEALHAQTICLPALQARAWPTQTVHIDLLPFERTVYTLLHGAQVPKCDLVRVCGGDLGPVERFLTLVANWSDAIPLGEEAIDECTRIMEFDPDQDEDEEDEEEEDEEEESFSSHDSDSDEASAPEAGALGAQAEVQREEQPTEQVEVEEGAEVEGGAAASRMRTRSQSQTGEDMAAAHAFESNIEREFNEFLEKACKTAEEKRLFFQRVARGLATGADRPSQCVVCMSAPSDCLFVCGHLLCHSCVVNVFVTTARQSEIAITDATNLVAPCPTCRWSAEPSEVFWMCSESPSALMRGGSKLNKLLELTPRRAPGCPGALVVFASNVALLKRVAEQLTGHGHAARVLSYGVKRCRKVLKWFNRHKHGVLLVPSDQAAGLKLTRPVRNAVFLHPLADDVERTCLQILAGSSELTVHKFIARDTIEDQTGSAAPVRNA